MLRKAKKTVMWLLSMAVAASAFVAFPAMKADAATAGQLREGTNYVIVSKQNGKALTVEDYATDNGADIVQMSLNNYESQVWTLDYDDNGYYQIINKFSGKVLDVPWASTDDGVVIEQFDRGGNDNQKWKITDAGGGYCKIAPKMKESLALNINGASNDDGASIIQWPYSGAANELWEIREVNQINANPQSNNRWNVTSPDGKTAISIDLSGGKLTYSVIQDGVAVLENSEMGINTSKGNFTNGLTYKSSGVKTINETYKNYSGIKTANTNHCIEETIVFTKNNVEFQVIARAYNDGVAFRYVVNSNGSIEINPDNEITTFRLPNNATVWFMDYAPYKNSKNFTYEAQYEVQNINNMPNDKMPSMPMLYRTGNKYALLMEAQKSGTYVGSMLQPQGNRVLRTVFDKAQTRAVRTTAPFKTPWRTLVIGDLSAIVSNTMVENLSPAPDNAKYNFDQWVEPGVSSWSWVANWGNGISDQTKKETHIKWIDLAAEMGWKYYILDEGWQPKGGSNYKGFRDWFYEVRDYAERKGVKLIVWVHKVDMDTPAEREERFKEWSEAGIAGIKVDFFYNENQEILQLHEDIYKDAAKYHMLVNVHGSNPPSGERRTYPNIIAREAIAGQEQGGITANQYTLIPFIRGAVGTADVTEELYSKDQSKTSMGFQIALSVLIENGIRSLGGEPADYLDLPEATSYYTDFPEKWDDVQLLDSVIGEYVNIARRAGDSWYAAGISVNERNVTWKPSFLDDNKTYTAIVYKEVNGQRQTLDMEIRQNVTKDSNLTFHMQNGGGYAVKLVPGNGGEFERFEAENAALSGGAAAYEAPAMSSGRYVGNVGGPNNGTVAFHVASGSAGNYKMKVNYATLEARQLAVIVNGRTYTLNCGGTGDWTAVGLPVELTVALNAGNNTIQLTGVNGAYAPNIDSVEINLSGAYEFENAALSGGAAVQNAANNSGGRYVGNVGGPNGGTATLTMTRSTAGKKVLRIYYATLEARQLAVVVNGRTYTVNCPGTGDWTVVGKPINVEVEMNAGNNTVAFTGVNGAYAPNLDCVEVQ